MATFDVRNQPEKIDKIVFAGVDYGYLTACQLVPDADSRSVIIEDSDRPGEYPIRIFSKENAENMICASQKALAEKWWDK